MIEELHNQALEQLDQSAEPTDNGTNETKRNMTVKDIFYRGAFEPSQDQKADDYTKENGLIIADTEADKEKNMAFLNQEWLDWKEGVPLGESRSQDCYPELWKGKFDNYCYSDRLGKYLDQHLENIIQKEGSRQNFLSIWDKDDEGYDQVPCTIGYSSQIITDDKGIKTLYVSFIYRSMEISRNMVNDLWLNRKYIQEILKKDLMITKIDVTYFIMNAHSYIKDFDLEPKWI